MPVIAGTIVFGGDLEPFSGATVHIRLEEVSRVNAPALLVAETVLPDARAGGPAPDRLAFSLEAPPLKDRLRYVVRVHVDVDADGQVSIGDYVSTMSHPVKVGFDTATLLIPVKRVS